MANDDEGDLGGSDSAGTDTNVYNQAIDNVAPLKNEYDAILDKPSADPTAPLKQSMFVASTRNPDNFAQARQLAAQANLPPDVVQRKMPDVQKALTQTQTDYDGIVQNTPKLGEWLQNPDNASVAHDDIPALSKIESNVQDYSTMHQMGAAWNAGLANLYSGIAKIPALGLDVINALGATASVTGEPSIPVPESLRKNSFTDLMDSEAKYMNAQAPKMIDSVTGDIADGNYAKAGQAFAVQLAHNAPTLAAIIGSSMIGQPEAGIALTAGGAGAESESAAIEKGISPDVAAPVGLAHAAIFAAMSEIKIGALDSAVAKWGDTFGQDITREVMQKFAGTLAYNATKMGGQMAVAHGADQFADYISGVNPDAFHDFAKQTADTFLSGAGTGLLLEGVGGANAMHESARQAGLNRDFYTALGDSAEATKLRERMPEAQKDLIQNITQGTPVENIYIQPEVFNQKVPDALKTLQEMGLSKNYSDAKAAGTDMKIPLADWTDKFVGTPNYKNLVDDIKFDPEQMSVNENEAALKEHNENQAAMQEMATPAPVSPLEEEGSRMQQMLQDKLEATGQSKAQAKAGSEQMVAFFRTHAENFGTSIADIANTAQVPEVEGEEGATQVPPGGETYNQSDAWKKEGMTVHSGEPRDFTGADDGEAEAFMKANPELRPRDFSMLDKDGNEVGSATIGLTKDKSHIYVWDVNVDEAQRRKGIATELYKQAEQEFGKSLQPGVSGLSEDSRALWNQPNRPFGSNVEPKTFEQKNDDSGVLGQASFFPNGESTIKLFKSQNASTFVHESGHVYLDALGKLVERSDAPEQVKSDYQAIREFIGAKDGEKITEAQHEQFAESFTKYLMGGKAPSARLEGTFERFKNWLTQLYQKASGFFGKAEITPQIRDVFDRLLATPEEIAQAQKDTNQRPLFDDPKSVGMDEAQAKKYTDAITSAKQTAEEDLTTRLMEDIKREQTRDWQTQLDGMKEDVAKEVDAQPDQIAKAALGRGTEPNGEPLPADMQVKLDRNDIVQQFGEERLKELPKPYVYAKEGGIPIDAAADLFGFKSGDELLTALSNAGDRDKLIQEQAEAQMKEKHGDVMADGEIYNEALKAIHNRDSSRLMRAELEHLASEDFATFKGLTKKIARAVPTVEDVRAQAEDQIDRTLTKDIQPSLFQRAEQKSAKAAMDAFLKGDFEGAFDAKKKQLLAHELYRAAADAKDETNSIVDFMNTFSKASVRERIGKAGGNYLEQIDNLLDRFEFKRSTSLTKLADRKSLLSFVQAQGKMGYDIQVPEKLLNEANKQSYKETSFEDLKSIRDTAENVKKLAYLKDQLLANEKYRQVQAAKDAMIASIAAHRKIKPADQSFNPSNVDKLVDGGKFAAGSMTKMEFLFRALDGYKANGEVWQNLYSPLNDAHSDELGKMHDTTSNLDEIFNAYTKKERAQWYGKGELFPELVVKARTNREGKDVSFDGRLNKAQLMSLALNWRNSYNQQAVAEGYGWTKDAVKAVLDRSLDARDIETVNKLGAEIERHWPEIAAMEKRLNGVAPAKVTGDSTEFKNGTLDGGYYPLKADPKFSDRTKMLDTKNDIDSLMGGGYARAQTQQGHTIEREGFGGKPVQLSLDVLTGHLTNVIHDLTHREAIIDTHKLVNDPDMKNAIIGSVGQRMWEQLNPWLTGIAGDYRNPQDMIERLSSASRSGMTTVNLGYKITSGLKHTLSYLTATDELGPAYAMQGLKSLDPRSLSDNWQFIASRSNEMKDRFVGADRDIRDAMKRLDVVGTKPAGVLGVADSYIKDIQRSSLFFMGYMDLATSIPAWMGAYSKAMDGNVENIEGGDEKGAIDYADSLVRRTKGSGAPKDLAAIQRGSEFSKNFTMFYSLMNLRYNNMQQAAGQFKMYKDVPALAATFALQYLIPAFLEHAVVGQFPSSDDKKHLGKYALNQMVKFPIESLPLARDGLNYLETKRMDEIPLLNVMQATLDTGKTAYEKVTGQKGALTRSDINNAVTTAGYYFHLPTKQALMTSEYLKDWMSGIQHPANPVEGIWRATVSGAPKK